MATIIFDFDHTLFDTKSLRAFIASLLNTHGVSSTLDTDSEKKHRLKTKNNYGFLEHLDELKPQGHNLPNKVIESFFTSNLEKHLKGDVHTTLKKLQSKKHTLILLTKGLDYFQKFKIRQSGIEGYFGRNIYICEDHKEHTLSHLLTADKTYFINDNTDEIVSAHKLFPKLHYIVINGPKTDLSKVKHIKGIKIIDDVSSLPKIIK